MCSRGSGPSNVSARRLNRLVSVATQVTTSPGVCDLTEPLGLTQPTISHHLAAMEALSELLSTGGRAWT
jgi:DNA-binding transcriptional ArsR family regulator